MGNPPGSNATAGIARASYMIKSGCTLNGIFHNLIYLMYLAHALHRICEQILGEFTSVDRLVAQVKKKFFESPIKSSVT